jgi:hypothetical protein
MPKEPIFKKVEYAIGRTGSRLHTVANFLRFFRYGMQNRYPICCILHFSLDNVRPDKFPAKERGSIDQGTDSVYVPCRWHMTIPNLVVNYVYFQTR